MNWIKLTEAAQLEEIKRVSEQAPVLIFKHSTTCSISAMSLSRLERKYDPGKAADMKCYYLDLKAYRAISNQIADDFNVAHESPQVLIIHKGQAIYHASHYDINFDELVAAVA